MRDPRERYVPVLDRLCEQGRLGRKADRGYYLYDNGKQVRTADADVRAVIEHASAERGITRRALAADEIVRRALAAMVNEAALLLAEGVAQRAGDIDVVLVQGYGFPRWQGGPVFWARQQNRDSLDAEMLRLGEAVGFGFVGGDLSRLLEVPAPA
jgi:3-hydroxyacyl-CoA dehydrogenase